MVTVPVLQLLLMPFSKCRLSQMSSVHWGHWHCGLVRTYQTSTATRMLSQPSSALAPTPEADRYVAIRSTHLAGFERSRETDFVVFDSVQYDSVSRFSWRDSITLAERRGCCYTNGMHPFCRSRAVSSWLLYCRPWTAFTWPTCCHSTRRLPPSPLCLPVWLLY